LVLVIAACRAPHASTTGDAGGSGDGGADADAGIDAPTLDITPVSLASGQRETCAIHTDGTLWCWGANSYGELGNGTTTPILVETQIGTAHDWVAITRGYHDGCGIRADGTLWCWGHNAEGEAGDGTMVAVSIPSQVGASHAWRSIVSAADNVCGIQADHSLWCWGSSYTAAPEQLAGSWLKIAVGGGHFCGLKPDSTVWCWGVNNFGQLGQGTEDGTMHLAPVQVGSATWQSLAAGDFHTCGVQTNGTLWCWGYLLAQDDLPAQYGIGITWQRVVSGELNACAVHDVDHWSCLGTNDYGENGNGTHLNNADFAPITEPFETVAVGYTESCGRAPDDTVKCWGSNDVGQLGLGYVADSQTFVSVALSSQAISATGSSTCSISPTGVLSCWGYLWPTDDRQKLPVQLDGTWSTIAGATSYQCGTQTDHSLWCGGKNTNGELGLGQRAHASR
jgi:alpha-tubulin suppressor-like RCC1 family protein